MNRRDIFKSLLGVAVAVSIDLGMSSPAKFRSAHEASFKPVKSGALKWVAKNSDGSPFIPPFPPRYDLVNRQLIEWPAYIEIES